MATPDLAGFRDAMDRLRGNFGQDVPFHVPVEKTWPDGTQLDPETGEPFDPAIEPLTGGWTDVVKHVKVISRPVNVKTDEAQASAAGAFSEADAILDIAVADYPAIEDATEATVYGVRYKITELKPDGLGGSDAPDRWLAHLEAK